MSWNPDPTVVEEIRRELQASTDRIYLGIGEYTPLQLIQELDQGTEIGQKLYRLHVALKEVDRI